MTIYLFENIESLIKLMYMGNIYVARDSTSSDFILYLDTVFYEFYEFPRYIGRLTLNSIDGENSATITKSLKKEIDFLLAHHHTFLFG